MSMRSIGVRLRLLTGDYKRDTDEAGKATDQLSEKITKAGKKSQADFDHLAMGAGIAGAALVAAAAVAVVAFAKFDKQMSEVGAVTNATAGEMDRLRQAALDAGAATVFSASEAAEAEAELAKAGVSTADILGGALTGSLDLAAAGSLGLADAATIAASAMNTFQLGGKDVSHIADVLAAAANKSAAGVDDLGQGLQQVGLIAAQVGFSLDETVGLLAAFADYGLKGSDGATSLKTALLRLAAPTGGAKELMDELGISIYDANGQLLGAVDVAGQLQASLKDLAPAQRNAALNTIFGSDAIRAANILYSEGEQGIQDYITAVDDEGAAARVASAKLDNLSGDVEALTGSLETLFITGGSGANGGLRLLVQSATKLVNAIGSIPAPVLGAITVLGGLSGGALLAVAATLKLRRSIKDMQLEMAAANMRASKTVGALGAVAGAAGRVAIAFAALAIAAEVFKELDVDVPILSDIFDSNTNSVTELTSASAKANKVQKVMTEGMEQQINAGSDLIKIWDTLHGAMVTTDSEALEALEAIDAVSESFKENGSALDRHTKAGLANRVEMEKSAKEAIEAAEAYRQETGDVKGANQMLEDFKKKNEDAAVAAGGNRKEVEKLADELYKLPPTTTVDINMRFTGLSVSRAIERLKAQEFRWGGVTEHAQTGLLRDANVYAPQGPARYAFAEPATGGEAFVPKNGNYGRSMGILSTAAGWYGASVVPGGGGGGSSDVNVTVLLDGAAIEPRMVKVVDESNRTLRRKVGAR